MGNFMEILKKFADYLCQSANNQNHACEEVTNNISINYYGKKPSDLPDPLLQIPKIYNTPKRKKHE